MAIITGKKVRKELGARKENAVESLLQVSIMSSGIKLRRASAEKLGVKEGDNVWYFVDEETNQVYLAKVAEDADDKSKVSKINTFTNKGLSEHLHALAGVDPVDVKQGDQIIFNVAAKATDKIYFELTFDSIKTAEATAKESDDEEGTETAGEDL